MLGFKRYFKFSNLLKKLPVLENLDQMENNIIY